jgi:hypothetical protein
MYWALLPNNFIRGGGLKNLTQTWHSFWHLKGFERSSALKAAAALVATHAGLRLTGFRRWRSILGRLMPAASRVCVQPNHELADSARAIVRMEAAAARHLFFHANCLEQSLVLWWMLRRHGVAAELRIGASKQAGRFEAHAWVEHCGAVLNDPNGEHRYFVPFDGPIDSMETQTH